MAASEAALILKYFGRAVSVASKPVQGHTSQILGTATTASTMQRLSGTPKRPVVQAHAELSSDANRLLAFLQMHGSTVNTKPGDIVSSTAAPRPTLHQQTFLEKDLLPGSDRRWESQDKSAPSSPYELLRYRNAGQTLHMMGFQNVANFSTQHQWLHVRATLDMNVTPMIRARSGIPAAHIAGGLNLEDSSHNLAEQAKGSLDTAAADCARGLLACLYKRHCYLPNIYDAVGCTASSLLKQVFDSFRRLMVPDQQMQLKGNAFLESQVVQDGKAAALSDIHQHFKHNRQQMT
ncbi:MAG: hypothetical protein FRX49_01137 [Trebouxia sp. A1-2]|nr:MAG: hypothetical protein FRX49_01137 [Trebouxia sp. A1-2]